MIQPLLGMIYTECDQIAAGSSGEDSDIADPDYELDAMRVMRLMRVVRTGPRRILLAEGPRSVF